MYPKKNVKSDIERFIDLKDSLMSEETQFNKENRESSKEIRKIRFTEEDDKKILELQNKFPGKWDKIGKILKRDK